MRRCFGSERSYAEHELYAQYRLAETLAATGDVANAEVELAAAHQRARSIGAVPLAAEMEALARRARLKLPAMARVEADSGHRLTGREREVLVLVRRAAPTERSPRTCSSARKPRVCTSPTSCPSLVPRTAPKPAPKRGHWDSTDCRCANRVRCEPR